MTPDEAKRLLDAQKDNEQFLQLKPAEKPKYRTVSGGAGTDWLGS